MRLAIRFALGFGAVAFTTAASADVVPNVQIDCPKGTHKEIGHSGPYCAPPMRADCPPGYEPQVYRTTSYCERPPTAPCPDGLHWESKGPDEASCSLNEVCEPAGGKCEHGLCKELSFCIEKVLTRRVLHSVAHGTCKTPSDCAAFPRSKCEKRATCTDEDARKREAERIAAAKAVRASAVPAPYVAIPGGDPPRYPVLKEDAQEPPPVPASSETPDVPAPSETPDASRPPDAGAAKPPSPGGCAGCEVGASDRDTAGWAALVTLLGLGIAMRRKGG
ncbi:MYXO-CTERM sorting domain-containing protein [Polyangium sp. y55x31]|uniref:MYXO-CTERM sorting domain-containing protein n=1 Tax=Polyangium sp. y55x31 TaxID=3042688 RepID=UPI0024828F44|nr:MYXO-CTERM sorting domain-containing protein [Polyangium sp. y55x31]MDI1483914.1 MYXO-CTERM sorting domain-containing protein [Polyangium sp. y55x31]